MSSVISIVFRGLLVFNLERDADGHEFFEIGILHEPAHHVPRIMTFRNGVREETRLLEDQMNQPPRLWQLVVDQPITHGVTRRLHGAGPINRMDNSTPEDDFRWMIDLENEEFPYGDIDGTFGLDRRELKHVVRITSGEFYTRLKSRLLRRKPVNEPAVDFGALAGVLGCDIPVHGGGAQLIGADPDNPIFTFDSDPKVMYEFANSPSDTVPSGDDHFPHYYEIFSRQPGVKFGFENKPVGGGTAAPGPNPALCGKIFLGQLNGTLV